MSICSVYTQPESVKRRIDKYIQSLEGLDQAQRHMVLSPAKIEKLVLARLTDEWDEPNIYVSGWTCTTDWNWDVWKCVSLYRRLRQSATKRCHQQERILAMKYNSRASRANRGGRASWGFYSHTAYAPKRGWMQGRPRK
jgi:hypothetical protein